MAKKYFWLKLKDDFFNQKEIKMLRKLAGGDTYTIIYLKMLLVSLKNDGAIYYDGIAQNMIEEIALDIDEDVENVQVCFNYLHQKGLIEFATDSEVEMTNIASMIGSETDSARRKRKERAKLRDNVTNMSQLGHTEIEKEIDIELDKDIEQEKEINTATDVASQASKEAKKEFEEEFEQLWAAYPNKKGKKDARRHYLTARKNNKVTFDELNKALKDYKNHLAKNRWKLPMNGSTWFNGRYEDSYEEDQPQVKDWSDYDFDS